MSHHRLFRPYALAFALILSLALWSSAGAAVDMFLEFGNPDSPGSDQIVGESQDEQFKDAIEVLSWSWGASNAGTFHFGGGGGAGKANIQDLDFSHHLDKASPSMMKALAKGVMYDSAILSVRRAGGSNTEGLVFLTIELQDVLVTSISNSANDGDDAPEEDVSLTFKSVIMSYIPQDRSGKPLDPIVFSWNVATNNDDVTSTVPEPVPAGAPPVSTGTAITVGD
ncbi:type VI secretion system tube protein Hcp [bacterium]|nr:type VI secretion system tube protein Hcp [bacterium]